MKTLLDVGNCSADHSAIRHLAESSFGARVLRADGLADCLDLLQGDDISLVTINRKLDRDHSDGLEIIKHLKEDERWQGVPVMMITNYDEHQKAAVAIGAEPGFGKSGLHQQATKDALSAFLSEG